RWSGRGAARAGRRSPAARCPWCCLRHTARAFLCSWTARSARWPKPWHNTAQRKREADGSWQGPFQSSATKAPRANGAPSSVAIASKANAALLRLDPGRLHDRQQPLFLLVAIGHRLVGRGRPDRSAEIGVTLLDEIA